MMDHTVINEIVSRSISEWWENFADFIYSNEDYSDLRNHIRVGKNWAQVFGLLDDKVRASFDHYYEDKAVAAISAFITKKLDISPSKLIHEKNIINSMLKLKEFGHLKLPQISSTKINEIITYLSGKDLSHASTSDTNKP